MSAIAIREITTLDEMLKQHPLIQQLNPTMAADKYAQLLRQMLPNGYRMVGVFDAAVCVGLSGFWINTKLYSGKYLEIDNFIVDAAYRSQQLGKRLADWLYNEAEKEGCQTIMLDAYTSNHGAHKFYFREGFHIKSYHFYKSL
ncbi:GNAT family N-acetyltransferase [Pontibacter sp. KCTC 32443]|uniref:GNAT family N-acetyltransferase n=1 Tax=Pontibacter TaxID=323449 RepID=UPI00164CEF32|nr:MULTISPECIES: GNAT family N-acetyltransferase [Pontibacter]MBC5775707.1 GNAT family N-acetyltransferase [Pontibacter sp. KCTC 32443]